MIQKTILGVNAFQYISTNLSFFKPSLVFKDAYIGNIVSYNTEKAYIDFCSGSHSVEVNYGPNQRNLTAFRNSLINFKITRNEQYPGITIYPVKDQPNDYQLGTKRVILLLKRSKNNDYSMVQSFLPFDTEYLQKKLKQYLKRNYNYCIYVYSPKHQKAHYYGKPTGLDFKRYKSIICTKNKLKSGQILGPRKSLCKKGFFYKQNDGVAFVSFLQREVITDSNDNIVDIKWIPVDITSYYRIR